MTLHLHFLLWIEGSIPLQDVRDKLIAKDTLFQQELIDYLESCHVGQLTTGSLEHVRNSIPTTKADQDDGSYIDPTLTLPDAPPQGYCDNPDACICDHCEDLRSWYELFQTTVDDIMVRSNVHKCFTMRDVQDRCRDRNGICTSRFPREIFTETKLDPETGHINMKKLEPWINTVTPTVAAVSRCNTDTTCLLSGTAVKATVGYVTDYVTKSSLKTYQVFSTMYDIFFLGRRTILAMVFEE
ncbi:hypothetical protein BJ165DRAFT_1414091 [Panaeolus papilionaceus]|nr:hypothetical protein BJ165DRAFT_1414091 [Panaeolus papilionaceus]